MTDPRHTATSFDKIAAEIEPSLIRLGRAAPGAELETVRDEITALLDGAGLRWSDVAERVAAPSPAKITTANAPPPMPPSPAMPRSMSSVSGTAVLSNKELRKIGGYRTPPDRKGYGYDDTPIPGADDPKPSE